MKRDANLKHAAVLSFAVAGLLAATPVITRASADPAPIPPIGESRVPTAEAPTPYPPGPRGLPPPRMPRAASIHVDRIGLRIDFYCAEGESTRACLDAAMPLLDKMNGIVPVKKMD